MGKRNSGMYVIYQAERTVSRNESRCEYGNLNRIRDMCSFATHSFYSFFLYVEKGLQEIRERKFSGKLKGKVLRLAYSLPFMVCPDFMAHLTARFLKGS